MENDSLVRRHDNYQFEIKLGYDLRSHHRRDHYRVDTFFFLPDNLDVNESTYTKERFYRDLLLYIRFRTPDFTLTTLTDPGSDRSPLVRAVRLLENCLAAPTQDNLAALDYEFRLFGCVVKNSLRVQIRAVIRLIAAGATTDQLAQADALLEEYVTEARRLAQRFRALRQSARDPALPPAVAKAHAFTDEYLSLLIEGRSHELLRKIQGIRPGFFDRHEKSIAALIESETAYRRSESLPSIVDEDSDNETFVFRLSVLKKYIASALHLSVRTREEGRGLEHMALAVGAGVAMVFATTVAFYYQRMFGTLSLGFFSILVISYMFKDRLKALMQSWLHGWLSKNLHDQSTDIRDPLNQEIIGVCREAVNFVPERTVDPVVLKLRNRDHLTEIENTWRAEKVIHYTKDITLYSQRFLKFHSRKAGVTDIVRFNLRNFMLKMDEPVADLYQMNNGRSQIVRGARVYHVNIVLRFASERETRYERIRLVLNRDGIKRIETVSVEHSDEHLSAYPFPLKRV